MANFLSRYVVSRKVADTVARGLGVDNFEHLVEQAGNQFQLDWRKAVNMALGATRVRDAETTALDVEIEAARKTHGPKISQAQDAIAEANASRSILEDSLTLLGVPIPNISDSPN